MRNTKTKRKIQGVWSMLVFNLFSCFLSTVVYAVIFYVPTAISIADRGAMESSQVFYEFCVVFCCTHLIFTLSAFRKYMIYAVVMIFHILGSTNIFFIINFKVPITYFTMKFVAYQNRVESALNIFSMQGVLLGVLSMLLGFTVLHKIFAIARNYIRLSNVLAGSVWSKMIVITYCFTILKFFSGDRVNELVNQYAPYNVFKYFITNAKDKLSPAIVQKNDISRSYKFEYNDLHKLKNVIIVFGEFMAENDLSINGYRRRNNMPLLAKRKANIVSFSGRSSENNILTSSILLRNVNIDDKKLARESSMISIFRRLGFKTIAISSHTKDYEQEMGMSPILAEAELTLYRSAAAAYLNMDSNSMYDHHIAKIIEDQVHNQSKRSNLIVVDSMTNRWPYHITSSSEFHVFHPSCESTIPSHCTAFELRNAYHNSVRYTDHMLNEFIKAIESTNSILFYVSNYGKEFERLSRRYREDDYDMENRNPAILVWVSDSFKEENADKFSNIKENSNEQGSMKNIFHSALGCTDIKSDVIDHSLNVCEKQKRR